MTMNHFNEYQDTQDKIKEIHMKIAAIKDDMYAVKGIRYDDAPRGSGAPVDISYFLGEIEELEQEARDLKQKADELKRKHEEEIGKVDKSSYKRLLRMFYLMRLDMKAIADALDVTPNHAWKMKKRAEIAFKLANDIKE